LYAEDVGISALTGLAGLTHQTELRLNDNEIEDIAPLATLTALSAIDIRNNQISDVNALVGMASIQQLYLRNNSIIDIGPLLNNAGLGTGDELGLNNNPLSEQSKLVYIPELVNRGVTVTY